MATKHNFALPITDENTLKAFVRFAWGVEIPNKRICENHCTPWEAFAGAYFCKNTVSVWKASRGFGGKSFLLSLLGLTEAVTLKADVNVLGGSGEQSERVLKYNQEFWRYKSAPRHLLASDPSKRQTALTYGNTIQALMASQASVRGPHPQRLRLDEIDEMDIKILDAAMGQPMNKERDGVLIKQQTVLSSTHQYADGTMTTILARAAEKQWALSEWCFLETAEPHGWLSTQEIEAKRQDVTKAMWEAEYCLQDPSPESRAIDPDKVSQMFKKSLGEFEGRNGEYVEIEPALYICKVCGKESTEQKECCSKQQEKAEYSTGADWAKKVDNTAIITLRTDCDPLRVVAFERCGRLPWPVMVKKFDDRVERYPGTATHDGTGLGDVVDGYITCSAESFVMVGRARSDLLSEYIAAVERCEIESPQIDFLESEHKYASVDDVFGRGHLPDSIAAMALAFRGRVTGIFFG